MRWGLRAIPLFLLFTRVRGETVWKSGRGSPGTLALSGREGIKRVHTLGEAIMGTMGTDAARRLIEELLET